MPRKYKHKTDRRNGHHKPAALPAKFQAGFLATMDNRAGLTKALRRTYQEVLSDVGGADDVSRIKQSLIERFCWLEAVLQSIENGLARGDDKVEALGRWVQACNSLSGLARVLGIERKAKTMPWTMSGNALVPQETTPNGMRQPGAGGGFHDAVLDHAAELRDK